MHVNKGKSVAQCLKERIDYITNPEKTDQRRLVTTFGCCPQTAAAEFLITKKLYTQYTGKSRKNDVIAYQVRQAFKPGEVTPEEANQIGYEFASRFLKEKHAFLVCTHIDRQHIHNHIVWNSTTLDGKSKFHNFLGSGKAVARLSDTICMEHKLSVIEHPQHRNSSYNTWLGARAQPSHRERLRLAIDRALEAKPQDFDALLYMLEQEGYQIKRGAHLTFSHPDCKRSIRLRTLGEAYSEEVLRAVIAGTKSHIPRRTRKQPQTKKPSLLIDIQAKLNEGKGEGYRRWASVFNLKQMAQTVLYLQEHDFSSYEELCEKAANASAHYRELSGQLRTMETQINEIDTLKTHVINYVHTRDAFQKYKASGYSPKYQANHERDIILHRAAKKYFNEQGLQKLPTVKSLQQESFALRAKKKELFSQLHALKREQEALLIHQRNVEIILDVRQPDAKEKEHESL